MNETEVDDFLKKVVSEHGKLDIVFNGIVHDTPPTGAYEMKEHIDYCFTYISKTSPIENQVALILKNMYDFQVTEIGLMLAKTEEVIKHLLNDARNTMTDIFEYRCALINKNGVCHRCSQMNEIFNPKQNQHEELMKLELVKGSKKYNSEQLFTLRTLLLKAIDPIAYLVPTFMKKL